VARQGAGVSRNDDVQAVETIRALLASANEKIGARIRECGIGSGPTLRAVREDIANAVLEIAAPASAEERAEILLFTETVCQAALLIGRVLQAAERGE
jgi:hypothetical protein